VSEEDKKKRKRFAVQLSSGMRDVGKVKSALMFATLAQYSGCDTVVYCVQDGADAVVKG
jgi:predicted peroxiredoxin